ncbi:MAG: efflux RND transporter periplasmic adaptor subunit [Robiginitomaculum sp.]|nr:efflux RND transporter periplasmic adaptor subunit [Robiginitomaculum sp.]
MSMRQSTIITLAAIGAFLTTTPSFAQSPTTLTVSKDVITDYRPVVARLESSDTATVRARIAGIIVRLDIDEGTVVKKGQVIATIRDESLNPGIAALDAKINGIEKQLAQYKTELAQAEKLFERGFVATTKRDQARTAVDITAKELSGTKSQRSALIAQRSKGVIHAPADARVTQVNVSKGSAVSPGEIIANMATLDGVVRLSLPERHAGQIKEGETISLRLPARGGETHQATITKVYPELRGGAVIADAVVDGGLSALVGERVDVLAPVGERLALRIPKSFITTRYGIDFVKVHVGELIINAPVTLANPKADADGFVEVLAGLHDGDIIAIHTKKSGE